MYVDESEIVVDVKKGQTTAVKEFMQENCNQLFQGYEIDIDSNVCFVEQNELPVFSGKRGAGLCF